MESDEAGGEQPAVADESITDETLRGRRLTVGERYVAAQTEDLVRGLGSTAIGAHADLASRMVRGPGFARIVEQGDAVSRMLEASGAFTRLAEQQASIAKMFEGSGALARVAEQQASIAKMFEGSGALARVAEQQASIAKMFEGSGAFTRLAEQQASIAKMFEGSGALARVAEQSHAISRMFQGSAFQGVSQMLANQNRLLGTSFEAFANIANLIYPENLGKIDLLTLEDVGSVVMDDGIPLYGVPRASIARALLSAENKSVRRAILGRRWVAIVDDCEAFVNRDLTPVIDTERRFALEAAAALRAGHVAASQALSANLLDTLITKHLAKERFTLKPSKKVKTPDGYGEFVLRKYWALAPIWSAYQHFHPESVPSQFGRHPTAHAVGRAQYSRRNAVQALMLVSSIVGYLDESVSGTRV